MKILAFDSSGKVASAAALEDDILNAEITVNNKMTHSQTLMPMIDEVLKTAGWDREAIDVIAISRGPGSFTGLRIGSGIAKGLAAALNKPIAEIPTLEAMAYNIFGYEGLICPMMDARRRQVYTGLYTFREGFKCLMEPVALSLEDTVSDINKRGEPVVLLGDGVPVYIESLRELLKVPYQVAPPHQNRQRAAAVGALAFEYALEKRLVNAAEHVPVYLRLSQAERERAERGK